MNESAVTTIPTDVPDFRDLYAGLKAVWDSDRTRDADWRLAQLAALERMMSECEKDIMDALAADLGKPAQESWVTEISFVSSTASYSRKNLRRWMKRRRVRTPMLGQPGRSWMQPEPLGVVLIIGPWNYPLQLVLSGLAAAIAAGNCAVLKPSELAPATSALLARLVQQYLDGECIRVVEGGVPETTAETPDAGHPGARRKEPLRRFARCRSRNRSAPYRLGQIHKCGPDLYCPGLHPDGREHRGVIGATACGCNRGHVRC
jgi:aldehyde dehydrogenase (NAD+)